MKQFTVIGLWEDTGQVIAEWFAGTNAAEAMRHMAAMPGNSDLMIIGALEGQHQLTAPCEDAGKAAYACDLIGGVS